MHKTFLQVSAVKSTMTLAELKLVLQVDHTVEVMEVQPLIA